MRIIRAKANQTVYDVALEQYGTCDAVAEILRNNPELTNDQAALGLLGITAGYGDFYPDVALTEGVPLRIDTDSQSLRGSVVRQIEHDITTFNV